MAAQDQISHLYVHVPFCPTICPFCSFHVLIRRDDLVAAYLHRLDAELAETAATWPRSGPLQTIYLGGGTPSQLTDPELDLLLTSIRRRFDVRPNAEISLEAHPRNVTTDRPARWRELGFNRVSVGVQSTQDAVLTALGRPHDAFTARRALDTVLATDGWTVNADLILAAAHQDIAADLDTVARSGVHHLSAYTLTVEPDTPFERRGVIVDEDHERRALELAAEILPRHGLRRYEVSNYSKVGHTCAHNVGYWNQEFWFGVGPSATAFLPAPAGEDRPARASTAGEVHMRRNPTLTDWLACRPADVENLSQTARHDSRILTGLRLSEGIDESILRRDPLTGGLSRRSAVVDRLLADAMLEQHGPRIRATPEGMVLLDHLLAQLW